MVAVAVRELHKRFGRTVVLERVSIDVPDGAFAVLVGPSGCGKSTLLRLLAGLEQPDQGSIRFGEREVAQLAPRDRDVAMVFQSYALYPHLSVRDNLGFGLRLRKTAPAEIKRRVDEVSEMLGLGQLLERMPRELSGGQRQRVAMGRAIVRRPALFLFDEPLSNLDAALRAQVRVDIRKLHQQLETTSVYVTHDQVEAMTLADVMFVLHAGRVEQSGTPLDIYHRPATRFVASFLGSPAMNFLAGRLEQADGAGWVAVLGAKDSTERVKLDAESFGKSLVAGKAVTVGIRPHDFALLEPAAAAGADDRSAAGGGPAVAIAVSLAEALGGETYAHGTLAGQDVVARLDPGCPTKAGDTLRVVPSDVHLFDPESGRSLRC
jgi:ABC-type sugar transport system ATPase subunit